MSTLTPEATLQALTTKIEATNLLNTTHIHQLLTTTATTETTEEKLTLEAFLGVFPASIQEVHTPALTNIYRLLCYLSTFPFHALPLPNSLSYAALLRALALASPEIACSPELFEQSNLTRRRTRADFRRLVFQGLASGVVPKTAEQEESREAREREREHARRNAFDIPSAEDDPVQLEFCAVNYDEDGDEMFHDVLDVLYNVQDKKVWEAGVMRAGWREVAKQLVHEVEVQADAAAGAEEVGERRVRVRELGISRSGLKVVVRLFLEGFFGIDAKYTVATREREKRENTETGGEEGLEEAAESVVKAFTRDEDGLVAWERFDEVVRDIMPQFFVGLQKLLAPLYQPADDRKDILDQLPSPSNIVTRPVLAQMGMLLAETVAFDSLLLRGAYTHTTNSAATSAEALTAFLRDDEELTVVLIAGRCMRSRQKVVFGFHLPWAGLEGAAASCLLFQLHPVQDVFPGSTAEIPRPGYRFDAREGTLVFGEDGKGVQLVLEKDLKRMSVRHVVSTKGGYQAREWRGNWTMEVEVHEIEIWDEV
ncbi:uncharacterized protein BP01DRAFT_100140 [Aspergillus saccharolyticus JOP 1030-1]|uniref:Uncharacterized protein n=1 Tax=Aspergillus saccharolyticus JOP 1030-1 TaxID=1450539 RepID=A0A318ZAP7_9EURO|nr:hypothetical protein BP01DRAFT_100140 [Aspergillus saccharolyticus JOP 1030-1]PYH43527.1 hypothetical protein BP01DRAFT_100140 [Aspergillus saccharolyticus JOP 1030-1]